MIDYVTNLKEEVSQQIRHIETEEPNVLRRSLAVAEKLEEVFDRLKQFIAGYEFADEEEEIHFFKDIKPRLFCHLLYYRKVYNIEMNRPMGGLDAQVEYLNKEFADISVYVNKRLDFYRYYRSGSTHLDRCYFLRGRMNREDQYRDSFYFERDPAFSTCGDFKVAKILSYDMLQVYLREELEVIQTNKHRLQETPDQPLNKPRWTDKKTRLIEVIYGLDTMCSIDNGHISLRKIQDLFEEQFDIKLGNISRAFNEMRIRNNTKLFLDEMGDAVRKRMAESENGRYNHHKRT